MQKGEDRGKGEMEEENIHMLKAYAWFSGPCFPTYIVYGHTYDGWVYDT